MKRRDNPAGKNGTLRWIRRRKAFLWRRARRCDDAKGGRIDGPLLLAGRPILWKTGMPWVANGRGEAAMEVLLRYFRGTRWEPVGDHRE